MASQPDTKSLRGQETSGIGGETAEGNVGFAEPPVCQTLKEAFEKCLMRSSQQPDDVDITYRAVGAGGAWEWALMPRGLMSWEVLELRVRP